MLAGMDADEASVEQAAKIMRLASEVMKQVSAREPTA